MGNDKALNMIGLCMRAGKLTSGEFSCDKAIKAGTAKLIIVASDASDNTKKAFKDATNFYKVNYTEYGTKETLGACLGKELRASVAILDEGFAKSIQEKMNKTEEP